MHLPTKRVVDVLTLLAPEKRGKRLCEISVILSIPKGTLSPILDTLLAEKLISKRGDYYFGGTELFALGSTVVENIPYKDMIRAELRALSDLVGETCYLGILDGGDVLYLDKADSTNPLRMLTGVGHKLPAYATGVGKALIMDKTSEELFALYPNGFDKLTDKTVTRPEEIFSSLALYNSRGYSEEVEESTEYIRCFGAPIKKDGKTVAAISVAIPTFRYKEEERDTYVESLLNAANRLGRLWV